VKPCGNLGIPGSGAVSAKEIKVNDVTHTAGPVFTRKRLVF
jgi:hypothetical protein